VAQNEPAISFPTNLPLKPDKPSVQGFVELTVSNEDFVETQMQDIGGANRKADIPELLRIMNSSPLPLEKRTEFAEKINLGMAPKIENIRPTFESTVTNEDLIGMQIQDIHSAINCNRRSDIPSLLRKIDLSSLPIDKRNAYAEKLIEVMAPVLDVMDFFKGLWELIKKSDPREDKVLDLINKAREKGSPLLQEPLNKLENMMNHRGDMPVKDIIEKFMKEELPKFEQILEAAKDLLNRNPEIHAAAERRGYNISEMFRVFDVIKSWADTQDCVTEAFYEQSKVYMVRAHEAAAKNLTKIIKQIDALIDNLVKNEVAKDNANRELIAKLVDKKEQLEKITSDLDGCSLTDLARIATDAKHTLITLTQPANRNSKNFIAAASAYFNQTATAKVNSLPRTTWS
jgi:hypothetical protein